MAALKTSTHQHMILTRRQQHQTIRPGCLVLDECYGPTLADFDHIKVVLGKASSQVKPGSDKRSACKDEAALRLSLGESVMLRPNQGIVIGARWSGRGAARDGVLA